jgi:hypothetical protein
MSELKVLKEENSLEKARRSCKMVETHRESELREHV